MEIQNSEFDTLNVMICDDSALMRNLISRMVNETPGMQVCGKASNGQLLLDLLPTYNPDIIVLDIEMPIMNGVDFLKERKKRKIDIPVVILSSIATKGAEVTMECLELGASDFITKPGGSASTEVIQVQEDLVAKLASYGTANARKHGKKMPASDFFIHASKMREAERFVAKKNGQEQAEMPAPTKEALAPIFKTITVHKDPAKIEVLREGGKIKIIALGISTGGPNALRDVFKMIDPHLKQPILVVQHMPAGFTTEFAQSLDRICPLKVVEAADEMPIEEGHIYIAPGAYHIEVEARLGQNVIRTNQKDPRNGHRPSADVLFESVAKIYRNDALGVIMTGMGRDGAAQITEMRKQGAYTLGQDEASAVVYGMPRVAYELGGIQKQVSLKEMADEISRLAREHA